MIIEDKNGNVFLEFTKVDEQNVNINNFKPLTHSLLLIKYQNKFLIVYDKWKQIWELPGGSIENNETTKECAIRELKEETNQILEDIKLLGVMKFQLKPDNRIEFGTLYSGVLNKLNDFDENSEIQSIKLWDKIEKININEIDAKLMEYFE